MTIAPLLGYSYNQVAGKKFQMSTVSDTNYRKALVAPTAGDSIREAHSYEYDNNGNILYVNTKRIKPDMTAQPDTVQRTREEKFRWDEENRLTALSQNGYVSHYWYDADGDGFYNWGVGSKPSSCPSWVPDEEDGDDSDYTKGSIDEYGFLHDIIPDQMDTIYIDQNTEYASIDFTTPRHILVRNNSTLTLSNHLTCYSGVSLTVEAGSKLSVSGGILDGVILKLLPGGEVTLSNNGTIIHSKSQPFTVPKGAILHQNSGVIR